MVGHLHHLEYVTRSQPVLLEEGEQARVLLRRFAEHPFSYVDACSFAVMRRLRLRRAFALDVHFEVAGFELLPRR